MWRRVTTWPSSTRRAPALDALVDKLTECYGPLDTAEDKAAIERYVELLS